MRLIEATLLGSGLAFTLALFLLTRSRSATAGALGLVMAAVLIAQLLLEGPRPTMAPIYAAAGVSVALLIWVWLGEPGLSIPRWCFALLPMGWIAGGLWAGLMHPVLVLPQPAGPFAVGVVEWPLDVSGIDAATVTAEQAPPQVRLWYPAIKPDAASTTTGERVLEAVTKPARPTGKSIDGPDPEPESTGPAFPLLVYFPGWPGTGVENMTLVRELASHGYAVATVEYPRRLPGMSDKTLRRIRRELEFFPAYTSEAVYHAAVAQSIARVRKRAADASALISAMTSSDTDSTRDLAHRVAARIDPSRVGMLGFSLGGAVATQTAWSDARIKAVVNMDGRHWADAREHGVRQPYLFLSEPLPLPTEADLNSTNADLRYNSIEDYNDYTTGTENLKRNGGYHVTIGGMFHMNFTDEGLRSRFERGQQLGPIDAARARFITSTYVLAFFDQVLRGMPSPLLNRNSPDFPEAQLEVFSPPAATGEASQ